MTHIISLVKKFAAIIFLCFLSTHAFAYAGATKGHYFQLDAINLKSDTKLLLSQEFQDYDPDAAALCASSDLCYLTYERPSPKGNGYGFNYKYAFSAEENFVYPLNGCLLLRRFFMKI